MQYLNNVPQASQSLGQTQVPIQANFTTIDAAFQQDHVPYTLSGQGKHNQVTFPVQSPAPSFLSGEVGLYNLLGITQNELWINKNNQSGVVNFPMTQSSLSNTTPTAGQGGWTYL